MSMASPFKLNQLQTEFLDIFMNKVSRSFALVIPFLEEPLNHYLATAYLICRVVDNIEDCEQPYSWKEKRFAEFIQLVNTPASASDILAIWGKEAWPGLTHDEEQLMGPEDGSTLWQIYSQIPAKDRDIIAHWSSVMAQGMSQIDNPTQTPLLVRHNGLEILANEDDYNSYCYFVAGTVGHMSTELVINHYGLTDDIAARLINNSEVCGRSLQKTNIVKDFAKDLERGICYLPNEWVKEAEYTPLSLAGASDTWRKKVIQNVLDELEISVEYLLDLPYHVVGYRMSSLLCLLPAYQTMLTAAQRHKTLFTNEHQIKISRETMMQCIQDAQKMIADNEAIEQYGQNITRAINAEFET